MVRAPDPVASRRPVRSAKTNKSVFAFLGERIAVESLLLCMLLLFQDFIVSLLHKRCVAFTDEVPVSSRMSLPPPPVVVVNSYSVQSRMVGVCYGFVVYLPSFYDVPGVPRGFGLSARNTGQFFTTKSILTVSVLLCPLVARCTMLYTSKIKAVVSAFGMMDEAASPLRQVYRLTCPVLTSAPIQATIPGGVYCLAGE